MFRTEAPRRESFSRSRARSISLGRRNYDCRPSSRSFPSSSSSTMMEEDLKRSSSRGRRPDILWDSDSHQGRSIWQRRQPPSSSDEYGSLRRSLLGDSSSGFEQRPRQRSCSRSARQPEQSHSHRVRFSDPLPPQPTVCSPRPRLVKSDMPQRLLNMVIEITADCLSGYNDDVDVSRVLKLKLESRLRGCWMVIVGDNYATFLTEDSFHSGTFAYFFIGRHAFLIFKSY